MNNYLPATSFSRRRSFTLMSFEYLPLRSCESVLWNKSIAARFLRQIVFLIPSNKMYLSDKPLSINQTKNIFRQLHRFFNYLAPRYHIILVPITWQQIVVFLVILQDIRIMVVVNVFAYPTKNPRKMSCGIRKF